MTINHVASEKGAVQINVDVVPSECSFCHLRISPIARQGWSNGVTAWVGFTCPSCNQYFIASYKADGKPMSAMWYMTPRPYLGLPRVSAIHNKASEMSTQFVAVYTQAAQAEEIGLDLICGVGYRKSLEFLIKDYAGLKNPNEIEPIKAMPLAQVIDRYVASDNIKEMAKRAIWIGNDETHYVKKWDDHDLKSLKVLIDLTMRWIESEILTDEYNQLMPGPKK
ncbi:MAG TPA: hypothetical protein VFE32_02885 [Puia sp.]|nr:hypothetical protein [Puia sp.]